MKSASPYLVFNGACEEAFHFYRAAFGGEFAALMRRKDAPSLSASETSTAAGEKIIHIELPLSATHSLFGYDVYSEAPAETASHSLINIIPDDKAEADKLFAGLATGGEVVAPLGETYFGSYFGMLADKFGVRWMLNCEE
ncbi:MAG: VOC family protein [Gammaproteobacteria bacterium]